MLGRFQQSLENDRQQLPGPAANQNELAPGLGAGVTESPALASQPGAASAQRGLLGDGGAQAATGQGAIGSNPAMAAQPPNVANFDADAAARYAAARQATAERKATFTNAPGVGQVLKPGQTAGTYRLPDSQVASTIFNGAPGAAEKVQAFLKAGGSRDDLLNAMHDYAAFDLRRAAENPDTGMLNQAKYQRWMQGHSEAMAAFPELQQRFQTAADASQAVDQAIANRAAATTAFQKSAAANFLGDADPVAKVGRILKSDKSAATMQDLARMTAGNRDARAGLQRSVAEYMLREMRGNADMGGTGNIKSDAFQTFVRKSTPALGKIFSPKQIQAMQDIATDLQMANRSISGTKLPGGSNTAQDLAAQGKHGHNPSLLRQLVASEMVGHGIGAMTGGSSHVLRALGTFGTLGLNAVRSSGLSAVDNLVTQAMLDPDLASRLLSKVKLDHKAPIAKVLGNQIRGIALRSGAPAAAASVAAPSPAPSATTPAQRGASQAVQFWREAAGTR